MGPLVWLRKLVQRVFNGAGGTFLNDAVDLLNEA